MASNKIVQVGAPYAPQQLSVTELLWYISVLDAKSGHYRFGEEAFAIWRSIWGRSSGIYARRL